MADQLHILYKMQKPSTLSVLDKRMAEFPLRHGNIDMPTCYFPAGVSTIPSLPANEVVPLFMMLAVAIGSGTGVFPDEKVRDDVQEVIDFFLSCCRIRHQDQHTMDEICELVSIYFDITCVF